MKLIVAIKSCIQHRDLGYHAVIRETWGKDFLGLADVRFFTGTIFGKHESDEIQLNCPDDYNNLPKKTQAICQWAIGKACDYLFLCDTDTYVIPKKLMACGFQNFDYVGKIDRPFGETFLYRAVTREGMIEQHTHCYPWASGGYGYFLSRKAFTRIAEITPIGWAEDLWIGNVLGPLYKAREITMLNMLGEQYSWHFPAHEYKSGYTLDFGWMQKMYAEHK
jgi:hypothetical protein